MILAAVIAVAGSSIGFAVAGTPGLVGALIGTAMALVFLGITAASIVVASKYSLIAFFGIVMGAWLVKFVLFLVLLLMLKDQTWIQPTVMLLCAVVAVVGTLIVDVLVIARSRLSYVSDITLPGQSSPHDHPE
ncbi:MAG: hypothetical protein ACYCZK_00920 [Microbacteriaceae bacterium]